MAERPSSHAGTHSPRPGPSSASPVHTHGSRRRSRIKTCSADPPLLCTGDRAACSPDLQDCKKTIQSFRGSQPCTECSPHPQLRRAGRISKLHDNLALIFSVLGKDQTRCNWERRCLIQTKQHWVEMPQPARASRLASWSCIHSVG